MIVTASVWRDGHFLTLCEVNVEAGRMASVIKTDKSLIEGDYEIMHGEVVSKMRLKDGQWAPHPGARNSN
jgi:hypothetical protein